MYNKTTKRGDEIKRFIDTAIKSKYNIGEKKMNLIELIKKSINTMREKYIDKNAIGIIGWAECDSKVQNSQMIAGLKMAANLTESSKS